MTPPSDHVGTVSNFQSLRWPPCRRRTLRCHVSECPGSRHALVSHIASEALTVRIDIGYADPVQGEAYRVGGNVAGGQVNIPDA